MLKQATEQLIATVRDPASTNEQRQAAASAFFQAASRSKLPDGNAALATLAGTLTWDDRQRAGFLAMVCGSLVEHGADPAPLVEPLGRLLSDLLESAAKLAEATHAKVPKSDDEDVDHHQAFEEAREDVAKTMPKENAAWKALDVFWPPAIAVYSVSPGARAGARGMRDLARKLADHHSAGHWLNLMLGVLDNEPILVIEPATRLGIQGSISGVVDNFQLNVLLMDGFPNPGLLAKRRVAKRVAEVARGLGPQQTDDSVTGTWNLYTWKAIEPGLKLPEKDDYGGSGSWIWNEGTPEDIPKFEERRVILLGPPSYVRHWNCQRMFDKLPASLEIERKLSKGEVEDALKRMVAAKSASL